MTADPFAGEHRLATGETLPVPPELLAAIQDACPEPIDADPALAAGRTAFARRFVAALFARDLLLVTRGRPNSKETVGVDAYSLVCSQKHALQAQLAALARPHAAPPGRDDPRGGGPLLTRRRAWGLAAAVLTVAAAVVWRLVQARSSTGARL